MLLHVDKVSLNFGDRTILNKVSLKVNPGKIISITGKSGSGKTTLLGIISGLLSPDEGKVFFNGKNILKWLDFRRSRYRNREIGFVFQFFNLLPDMTAFQNIVFPTTLRFFPKNVRKEPRPLASYLNITDILHQSPATLSGGERQRVAIARAIINHPKIILADEPTGNLDDLTAEDIVKLFVKLKKDDNKAIVLVTHDHRIVKISDEHYHLENGILYNMKDKKSVNTLNKLRTESRTAAKKAVKKKK
jgi:lipoprotein-releasing system ATP-binding protein